VETYSADNGYINYLQNTAIVNNSSGTMVVGLIFSSQIIGIGHNIGSVPDIAKNMLNEDK
jgi:hypothetical protein